MNIKKITRLGLFSALSVVLLLLIRFPLIPAAPWLIYDAADVSILIASFALGPIAGLTVTVIASIIQGITVSAEGGWVGIVMHILASGAFAVTAGLIYKKFHSRKGAVIALICGTIAMTLIMIPANLFFTVRYWGYPYETVVKMILPMIVPFNLIKGLISSTLTILIYKKVHNYITMKLN